MPDEHHPILINAARVARLGAGYRDGLEVAALLGIHWNTLYRYERGAAIPGPILARMADLYGCSVDALLGRTSSQGPAA